MKLDLDFQPNYAKQCNHIFFNSLNVILFFLNVGYDTVLGNQMELVSSFSCILNDHNLIQT